MTAADLIRICLELDQQVLHPRPSEWGKAALLIRQLSRVAKDRVQPQILGDFESIDLSVIENRAPELISQPTLDRLQERHYLTRASKANP